MTLSGFLCAYLRPVLSRTVKDWSAYPPYQQPVGLPVSRMLAGTAGSGTKDFIVPGTSEQAWCSQTQVGSVTATQRELREPHLTVGAGAPPALHAAGPALAAQRRTHPLPQGEASASGGGLR